VPLPDRRLEAGQVDLVQGTLVDQLVDGAAVGLLVVRRVVLHVGDDALGLDAAHVPDRGTRDEVGILAVRLEGPAVDRYPGDVDVRPLQQVPALRKGFPALHHAVPAGQLRIPGRGEPDRRGQRGGRRLDRSPGADPGRAVVQAQGGQAQPRQRRSLAGVRGVGERTEPLELLVEGHLRDDQRGALVRVAVPVHPRLAGARTTGVVVRDRRCRHGQHPQEDDDQTHHSTR
jgi:hypothetical protein